MYIYAAWQHPPCRTCKAAVWSNPIISEFRLILRTSSLIRSYVEEEEEEEEEEQQRQEEEERGGGGGGGLDRVDCKTRTLQLSKYRV